MSEGRERRKREGKKEEGTNQVMLKQNLLNLLAMNDGGTFYKL